MVKQLLVLYFLSKFIYIYKSTKLTNLNFILFRYPSDINTYNIDSQFLWGSALLISPVLKEVMFKCIYKYLCLEKKLKKLYYYIILLFRPFFYTIYY